MLHPSITEFAFNNCCQEERGARCLAVVICKLLFADKGWEFPKTLGLVDTNVERWKQLVLASSKITLRG